MKPPVCTVKIDWLIENFTCWMSNVHGKVLETPDVPYFPGFKASLHKSFADQVDVFKVSCVFGKQGDCEGKVSVFCADDMRIAANIGLPEQGGAVPIRVSGVMKSFIEYVDRGDNVRLQFRFFPPRSDVVSVGMSTTLEVLSEIRATFSISDLTTDLVSDEAPKMIFPIRYVRPDSKGEEEQVQLELIYIDDEYIYLVMKGLTKWAFRGLSCKMIWYIYGYDNSLLHSDIHYVTLNAVMDCGSFRWYVTEEWRDYLLSDVSSRIRIQLKFFTGKVLSRIRGGGVLKRKTVLFVPSSRYIRPCSIKTKKDDENWTNLRKELMSMYKNKLFTDFEFRCGETSIAVHKAILCARCPVFQSMLSHDMKEVSSGSVDIEDIDFPTLEQFIAYLYTGAVDNMQVESAIKLYYTADKYQVCDLKKECSKFLAEEISVSDACDVLSLADRHGDVQLTSCVQKYLLSNFRYVAKSKEWQSYMRTDPELLVKTVTYFASNGYFQNIFEECIDIFNE